MVRLSQCRIQSSAQSLRGSLAAVLLLVSQSDLHATQEPKFHIFSWSTVPSQVNHLTPMVSVSMADTPKAVHDKIMKQPAGLRCLLGWDLHEILTIHPQDVCLTQQNTPTSQLGIWPVHGSNETMANYQKFFADFAYLGGKIDVMVLDYEKNYHKVTIEYNGGSTRWAAIENDPRFPAVAAQLGFSDITPMPFNSPQFLKWNSVAGNIFDQALHNSVYVTAKQFYPNVKFSNYGSFTALESDPSYNYSGDVEYRETTGCGTHDSRRFYGYVDNGLANKKMGGKPALGKTPWTGLAVELYSLKAIRRASNRPIHPWIPAYSFKSEIPGRDAMLSKTPYYDELIRQLAVHGCTRLMYWNPPAWKSDQNPAEWNKPEDALHLDAIAGSVNAMLSGTWVESVCNEAFPWDTKVIAGGLKMNNMTVYRFSFAPGVSAIKVWVNNKSKVIASSNGEVGAWLVLSPTDVLKMDPSGLPAYELANPADAEPPPAPPQDPVAGGDTGFDPGYGSGFIDGDVSGQPTYVVIPQSSSGQAKSSGKSAGSNKLAKAGGKKSGGGGGGGGGGSSKSKSASSGSSKKSASSSSVAKSKSSSMSSPSSAPKPGTTAKAAKGPARYSPPPRIVIVDISALREGTQLLDGTILIAAENSDEEGEIPDTLADPSGYASANPEKD